MVGLFFCFLAYVGYHLTLNRKYDVRWEFIPSLFIVLYSLVLYFFGLYQNLYLGTILFLGLGSTLLVLQIYGLKSIRVVKVGALLRDNIASLVFVVILSGYVIYTSFDGLLTHYDDFSHWGLAVKNFYFDRRLPHAGSVLHFVNYPPMSALSIYSFLQWLPYREDTLLLIRGLILIAFLLPFVSITKKQGHVVQALNMILILSMFGLFPRVCENLLVDYNLALVAALGIRFHSAHNKKNQIIILLFLSIFIYLVLVKDSGKFFAIYSIVLLYLAFPSVKRLKLRMVELFAVLAAILISDQTWKLYLQRHIPIQILSEQKFQTDQVSNLTKSNPIDIEFLAGYFQHVTKHPSAILFVIFIIVFLFVVLLSQNKKHKEIRRIVLITLIIISFTSLYHVGLIFIYKNYMNPNEVLEFAGYNRYISTYIAFLLLVLLMLIYDSENNSLKYKHIIIVLLLYSFSLLIVTRLPYYVFDKVETTDRKELKQLLQVLADDGRLKQEIVLYNPQYQSDSSGYLQYQLSYELLSKKVKVWSDFNPKAIDILEEYLIHTNSIYVLEMDETISTFLLNYYSRAEISNQRVFEWNKANK